MTPTSPPANSSADDFRGSYRLAVAVIVFTTITILKGAMTTSTGSGMAFLDWPLSDGQLMPERSYTTVPGFLEHFHRLFGALTGVLTIWLVIRLQKSSHSEPTLLRTGWFALGLIIVQGVVGGVGVRLNTPAVTSVIHGVLAQLTLASFAWIAYQLSPSYRAPAAVPGGGGRGLALALLVLLVLQTLVGGIARHTNSMHALWTHVGNAVIVFLLGTIATGFAVGRLRAVPGIPRVAKWLASLLILQIALGFVALLVRNSAGKTPENVANLGTAALISVHVLLGAILTVLAATLVAHVYRGTRPAASSTEAAGG